MKLQMGKVMYNQLMNDTGDLRKASAEESGAVVHPNWEAMSLSLLSTIASEGGQPIQTVCYAGCGSDSTPSTAIPAAVITYIDPDPANSKGLNRRPQDQFHLKKLEDYIASNPVAQFDMVYLLDSYAPNEEAVNITKPGGVLVVNNWLGHANDFFSSKWSDKGVVLVGAFVREKDTVRYEINHPADSLTTVQSQEELDEFVRQVGQTELEFYEQTQLVAVPNVIRSIFSQIDFKVEEGEDIVVAYKRFYDEQLKAQKAWLRENEIPEDLDVPLTIKGRNDQNVEIPRLPPKMANVVLWVFEKRTTSDSN